MFYFSATKQRLSTKAVPSLFFALSFGIAKGFQLLLALVFAWLLTPEQFGIFDITLTVIAFINILTSCSLESAMARFWFQKDFEKKRALLFSSAASFHIILSLIITITIVAAYNQLFDLIGHDLAQVGYSLDILISFTLLSGLMAVGNLALMILRLETSYKEYSIQNLTLCFANFLLPVAFYMISENLLISLSLGLFFSSFIFAALGCYFCWQYVQTRLSGRLLANSLFFAIPLVPAVFLDWVNQQIDRILLLLLLGIVVVSQYGFVARVVAIMFLFIQLFQLLWLAKAMTKIETDDFRIFFRSSLNFYLAISFFAVTLLTLFLPEIIQAIYGNKYSDLRLLITVLLIAISLNGASNILNVGIIKSKKTYWNLPIVMGTSLLNGIVSYYCIIQFGIWGAAFGTLVAYLMMSIGYATISYYKVNMVFAWQPILYFFSGTSLLIFYSYFVDDFSQPTQILVLAILLGGAAAFLYKELTAHINTLIG